MNSFKSFSEEQTERIGEKFGSCLKGTEIVAIFGEMGVGKTAFTRGVARRFGLDDRVSSPTFSIVNVYEGRDVSIYHFDMYRVNSFEDLESTGFYDYVGTGVTIIEWSENVKAYLPKGAIKVEMRKGSENERNIYIEGAGPK